jgi:arylformamidase
VIYDISPPISERLAVWPGDTPMRREVLSSLETGQIGANITLSTLHGTVHLGAHADAPSHYGRGAAAIDQRDLDLYLGPAQVIRVEVPRGGVVTPSMMSPPFLAPRLLLTTGTFPDPAVFNEDFAALTPELVAFLAGHGVRLVGIDTPSVDPFTSKDLPAHHAFLKHDMAILEGLVLSMVPEGLYELIALPLRLVGFDASPVRAVLRSAHS